MTDLTPEQAEYLAMIDESSLSELTLVNNLLDLVKLECDGIRVDEKPFSLRQCIDEVLQVNEPAARAKGLELYQELPPDLPLELVGDMVRLRQILHALVGNAIKFTDQGSVTVRVSTELQQGLFMTRFCVIDTGIGVEPCKQGAIFEPFIQSDMSHSRRFGGLGLGLPICRRLTAALQGRIWCESVPGKGSSFCIELPLKPSHQAEGHVGARRSLLVLVAEDDYMCTLVAERLLKKLGHQVVTAVNGREAVEKWERMPFDLILMDISMPEMTGFEALQLIRQREIELERPRVSVVALTAFARWNFQESFLNASFDGFLQKPLNIQELEGVLNCCCPD